MTTPTLSERVSSLERETAELPELYLARTHLTARIEKAETARLYHGLLSCQADPRLDPETKVALIHFQYDGTLRDNIDFLRAEHVHADFTRLVSAERLREGHYKFIFDTFGAPEVLTDRQTPTFRTRLSTRSCWVLEVTRDDVEEAGASAAGKIAEPHERTDGAPDAPIVSTIPTAPSADETPAPPSDDLHEDAAPGSASSPAPSAEETPAAPGGEPHEDGAPEVDETTDFVKENAPLAPDDAFSDPTQQGGEMPESEPEHEPEPADPADDQEEPEEAEQREPTARERLQEYFQGHPDTLVTCHTLAAALTMPLSTVKAMLRRLAVDGEIEIITPGTPKAAATYRARRAAGEESTPAVDDTGVDVPSAALEERGAATLTASTLPDVFVPAPEIDTSPEHVESANTTPAPAEPPAPVPAPEPDRWGEAALSDPEKEALGCLRRAPNGMSAGLLASRLGWRKSSAQSILDDLITAGFVRQESGTQFKAVR